MTKFSKIVSLLLTLVMVAGIATACIFTANAAETAAPSFNVTQTNKSGNKVTVAVNLSSGGFNAVDFKFKTSSGVKCDSINMSSGLMGSGNPANGYVAAISSSTYTKPGSVITATFTVPANSDYSISGEITDCTIYDASGNYRDVKSSSKVTGSASGTTKTTTTKTTTKPTTKPTTKTTTKPTTTKKGDKPTTTKKGDKTTTTKKDNKDTNIPTTDIDSAATATETTEAVSEDVFESDDFGEIEMYDEEESSTSTKLLDKNAEKDSKKDIDWVTIAIIAGAAVLLIAIAIIVIVVANKKKNGSGYEYDD